MGKCSNLKVSLAGGALLLVSMIATSSLADPKNGQVVGGSATIQGIGTGNVIIDQSSQRAIINWQSFNIAPGETTRFNQPNSSSVALNRVTGDKAPSQIFGTLSANGQVFLINPEGFVFGPSAAINTAGFLATTSDIRNTDFLAGKYNFNIAGNPAASIVNQGKITVSDAGIAALVAPGVRNDGVIAARFGNVALASANSFTLDFYGDNLIKFQAGDAIASQVIDTATGKPLKNLVENRGTLSATGGTVAMTAVTARAVVDNVINNSGVIEARSAGVQNGRIVLGAETATTKQQGAATQKVVVSGKLDASGSGKGERGGVVRITGETIALAGTIINAAGDAGGGKVLVGGDTGGGNPSSDAKSIPSAAVETIVIPAATTVMADAASSINASAITSGNGGKVVVWSDGSTNFAGSISARGGALGGNGGFTEVSGRETLAFSGIANLGAPAGLPGTLLLDPKDVTIGTSGTWVVTPAALAAALAANNVIVNTSAAGSDFGDITVAQGMSWSNANTLTLSANRNIMVMPGVVISNTGAGSLVLRADSGGSGVGAVAFQGTGKVDFSGSTGAVSIYYDPVGPLKYQNRVDYSAAVVSNPGVSNQFNSYTLVNNLTDLQSINQRFSGKYALGKNIVAGGAVIAPIGNDNNFLSGTFDGLGHTIDGLRVVGPGLYVGLFAGLSSSGNVRNVGLTNLSVRGSLGYNVGGLVGRNRGQISESYTTGSISGTAGNVVPGLKGVAVGGIAGWNFGTIVDSSSTASVTSPSAISVDLGGLSGGNSGTILRSSATGSVHGQSGPYGTGIAAFGGLVGYNETTGNIAQSFAAGSVVSTGTNTAGGGLVGYMNGGSITQSYATGPVTAGSPSWVGGLVGVFHNGTIAQSHATGNIVVGDLGDAGGLVGQMDAGTIRQAYATGSASGGQGADTGGLVGHAYGGTITQTFATGHVSVGPLGFAGGLTGENYGVVVSSSYWDKITTGQVANGRTLGVVDGAVGLTTAQLKSGLPTGFANPPWVINGSVNSGYPDLLRQIVVNPTTPVDTRISGGVLPVMLSSQNQQLAAAAIAVDSGQINSFKEIAVSSFKEFIFGLSDLYGKSFGTVAGVLDTLIQTSEVVAAGVVVTKQVNESPMVMQVVKLHVEDLRTKSLTQVVAEAMEDAQAMSYVPISAKLLRAKLVGEAQYQGIPIKDPN